MQSQSTLHLLFWTFFFDEQHKKKEHIKNEKIRKKNLNEKSQNQCTKVKYWEWNTCRGFLTHVWKKKFVCTWFNILVPKNKMKFETFFSDIFYVFGVVLMVLQLCSVGTFWKDTKIKNRFERCSDECNWINRLKKNFIMGKGVRFIEKFFLQFWLQFPISLQHFWTSKNLQNSN